MNLMERGTGPLRQLTHGAGREELLGREQRLSAMGLADADERSTAGLSGKLMRFVDAIGGAPCVKCWTFWEVCLKPDIGLQWNFRRSS